MPPRKPKLLTVNEAKSFDFDAFIQGFKRPEFTRNLYQRADLLPRLTELDDLTNDIQARLDKAEAAEGDKPERSIDDVDVVTTLRARLDKLIVEFNDLYNEYEQSAVPFTFRVPDQAGDRTAVKQLMEADGLDTTPPKDDDDALEKFAETHALYSMSVTCTSHPMQPAQWKQFREHVGEAAFGQLVQAWVEAVKAAAPSAPFAPKPSPTPPSDQS